MSEIRDPSKCVSCRILSYTECTTRLSVRVCARVCEISEHAIDADY